MKRFTTQMTEGKWVRSEGKLGKPEGCSAGLTLVKGRGKGRRVVWMNLRLQHSSNKTNKILSQSHPPEEFQFPISQE